MKWANTQQQQDCAISGDQLTYSIKVVCCYIQVENGDVSKVQSSASTELRPLNEFWGEYREGCKEFKLKSDRDDTNVYIPEEKEKSTENMMSEIQ